VVRQLDRMPVGGGERQTYTLYGDTVNLAQRLEELNKELDTDCLICGTTFKAAESNCVDAVAMGWVRVRGRESAVEVFALGRKSPRRETLTTGHDPAP